jgi:hypothetical protein
MCVDTLHKGDNDDDNNNNNKVFVHHREGVRAEEECGACSTYSGESECIKAFGGQT